MIPVGDFTEGDTFDILPLANFLSVFEEIDRAGLKDILEHAVSRMILVQLWVRLSLQGKGPVVLNR